jgi:hypothetical protein
MDIKPRAEHVVGENGAELDLREQQEGPNPDSDRHVGIEVMRLGQERAMNLQRLGLVARGRRNAKFLFQNLAHLTFLG